MDKEVQALEDILWRVYLPENIINKLGINIEKNGEEYIGIKGAYIWHFYTRYSNIFDAYGYKLYWLENINGTSFSS